ncbi:hypothetical protein [Streptomyces sp. NPDC051704]|uniref:hypothetical protein n=1 Tax=Streptomyces sp. NPDC051704 TaxID=3365671 RepID=UPI0037BCA42E
MSTTHEFEIDDLLTAAPLDGLAMEMAVADDSEEIEVPSIGVLAQTSTVVIYDVDCTAGATTKFLIPVLAWGWKTRLGYYRTDTGRIGLSPIFNWNRSFYPGSNPSVRFRGRLPTGTKDLRAFWWYDGGPTWWNSKAIDC